MFRIRVSASGTELEWIQHDYSGAFGLGGHCFPGSTDDGTHKGQVTSFACDGPDSFDWGAEVLAWFETHPPRAPHIEAQ